MSKLIEIEDLKNLTDQELRREFKSVYKHLNGDYIYWICKNCGNWKCKPLGRISEAEIVSICSKCE